jgi:16S rRNA (cytosine1402-N4)-methyltransferase
MPHIPVLLKETLEFLNIKSHGTYLDCTLGGCGHAQAIAAKLTDQGHLIGTDYDPAAVTAAQTTLKNFPCQKTLIRANFKNIAQQLPHQNSLDGLIADLGYSSIQLADPAYGLSWKLDTAALDMRLSSDKNLHPAAQILNHCSEHQLIALFQNYGELRATKKFVKVLLDMRKKQKFQTMAQLKAAVQQTFQSIPGVRFEKMYNQVFQALRIEVNQELENLQALLTQIPSLLRTGGVAVILSFHSLEDRLVKQAFRSYEREQFKILTPKPLMASEEEQKTNSRSKSAKLRAIQKI